MKIVFEVEKEYKGKVYFPGVVYEVSKEVAEDIMSKTKFAHNVEVEVECYEDAEIEENASNVEQDAPVQVADIELEDEVVIGDLKFTDGGRIITPVDKKNKKSKRNAQ